MIEQKEQQKVYDNNRLSEAIIFATQRHRGQFRKGTSIPYIVHPMEALQILYSMRADTNLLIAGVLHDTVEDTDTTLDEIREKFGDDVADLVATNSEDKSKTWQERKEHTIRELANADIRVKMLIMADKVSNIRSIATDFASTGDKLWERFNAPKAKQAWYYSGIQDALYELADIPECEKIYWEFVGLFKDVFVKFYLDEKNEFIFQSCDNGETHYVKRGNPWWYPISELIAKDIAENITSNNLPQYYNTNPIPEDAVLLSRKDAEFLEDVWKSEFWDWNRKDSENGSYPLYHSKRRNIDLKISENTLVLSCQDFGPECQMMNGKDEYEFFYELDEENTRKFLMQVRMKHGFGKSIEEILKDEFGKDNGSVLFEKLCKYMNVNYKFISI